MSDQWTVTAYHEAGHAVAAVMRGGCSLTSVTLSQRHGEGITWYSGHVWDQGFVAYAGAWAEARVQWPADVPLDDEDDDGTTFQDHVSGVLLGQPNDMAALRAASKTWGSAEDTWAMELEREWPAVQSVAARLLAGETVTDAQVRALVEGPVS